MHREQASIHLKPMSSDQLAAAVPTVRASPKDAGTLARICRRIAVGEREELEVGELDVARGLVGDSWINKPSKRTPDGSPNIEQQLTLMNIHAAKALGERWLLAGDNLYVDLDLSPENLPPGTRLAIGGAVIEVTATPHTGCDKFTERFSSDATKWVNSQTGRELNLRGINARVIVGGAIRRGEAITKVA
jgi:hypothetical protein